MDEAVGRCKKNGVAQVLMISPDAETCQRWRNLSGDRFRVHPMSRLEGASNRTDLGNVDLLILDSSVVDSAIAATIKAVKMRFPQGKILILGDQWDDRRQIEAIAAGVQGYCAKGAREAIGRRAMEAVLSGNIWVHRSLVPKLIGLLVKMVQQQRGDSPEEIEQRKDEDPLALLSSREMQVAKMVKRGETNKGIADRLFISERTVKAHLGSIFRKLGVQDRLRLAIYLKDLDD